MWALGWGVNLLALDSSSPRGHSIVLLTTIVLSVVVALVGVQRALGERMSQRRASLGALVVGVLLAGVEFSTLIVIALHALARLDGS